MSTAFRASTLGSLPAIVLRNCMVFSVIDGPQIVRYDSNFMARAVLWIAAIVGILFLLIPPLHHGWTHVETDFPNYYTAAKMFRERQPLRDLYDWTTFQRQMNYAGWGLQLGGYIPHTPLTALPMVPFAWLPPMTAKRVWLSLSLIFLAAAIWIRSEE